MSRQLDGRVAVVTGAGRGIGRARRLGTGQPPAQIGAGLHDRLVAMRDGGLLASPDQPARTIAGLVIGDTTGQIAGAGALTPISA